MFIYMGVMLLTDANNGYIAGAIVWGVSLILLAASLKGDTSMPAQLFRVFVFVWVCFILLSGSIAAATSDAATVAEISDKNGA